MAATRGVSDEDLHMQNEFCRDSPNNNGTSSAESCKDLLRVCPELGKSNISLSLTKTRGSVQPLVLQSENVRIYKWHSSIAEIRLL